jgi:hypothetical protein
MPYQNTNLRHKSKSEYKISNKHFYIVYCITKEYKGIYIL